MTEYSYIALIDLITYNKNEQVCQNTKHQLLLSQWQAKKIKLFNILFYDSWSSCLLFAKNHDLFMIFMLFICHQNNLLCYKSYCWGFLFFLSLFSLCLGQNTYRTIFNCPPVGSHIPFSRRLCMPAPSVCFWTPRLSLGHPGSFMSVHDLKYMRT